MLHSLAVLALLCAGGAAAGEPQTGQFQFLLAKIKHYGFSITSRGENEGPTIEGDAYVAEMRSGRVFHCRAKFGVTTEKAPDGKSDHKMWTSKGILCKAMTYVPAPDPRHSDYTFSQQPVAVDDSTYLSSFRLDQQRGQIAFCTSDDETLLRCSPEIELK